MRHGGCDDGTATDATQVLIGEGAYEGLYAVVETETTPGAGGGVALDGYIVEGTSPTQLRQPRSR